MLVRDPAQEESLVIQELDQDAQEDHLYDLIRFAMKARRQARRSGSDGYAKVSAELVADRCRRLAQHFEGMGD